ncbi:MAG: hypothetical protein HC769_26640 [Cyanobacteria bacterium CRU_2_1]|nr:hypothetical protein [Cyanobacteria bacterium CRU_2_1]
MGVLFPEFSLHSYFLQLGKDQLTENLLNEILSDGVHIELSTHYHQLSLKSCLEFVELAQMNDIAIDRSLLQRLAKGLEFYQFMQHPNGEIPLINDADEGDFRYVLKQGSCLFQDESLLWAATLGSEGKPPQILSKYFDRSGYFVFCDTWGKDSETYQHRQHVFYDCAQLGEGTHAHFDLFSFCYYVNGQPAIIDPGRYTYDAIPDQNGINWRKAFKSTAYHNTVEIDGKDQTCYIPKAKPGKFKFGSPIEVLERDFCLGNRSDWVSAKAKSAEYSPIHQRFFLYMHRQYLLILDRVYIDDAQSHQCTLRFHLSPEFIDRVSLKPAEHSVIAIAPALTIHTYQTPGLNAQIESGWASKKYGIKTPAPVIALTQVQSESLCFCTAIAPSTAPQSNLEILSLQRMNDPTDTILLLRVEGILNGQLFYDYFCFSQQNTPAWFQRFGLTFRGHFLGIRIDHQGKLIYLISQKAQQIEIETDFQFTSEVEQSIEWLV